MVNEITQRIVSTCAKAYAKDAIRGGEHFDWIVENVWWDEMIATYGVPMKERALHLYKLFHPSLFDEEGFLKSYEPAYYDIEVRIGEIVVRALERKIEEDEELQLQMDEAAKYMAKTIVQPAVQGRMF